MDVVEASIKAPVAQPLPSQNFTAKMLENLKNWMAGQ